MACWSKKHSRCWQSSVLGQNLGFRLPCTFAGNEQAKPVAVVGSEKGISKVTEVAWWQIEEVKHGKTLQRHACFSFKLDLHSQLL